MKIHSRIILCLGTILYFFALSQGLRCWSCQNKSVYQCIRNGTMELCRENDQPQTCFTRVAHIAGKTIIQSTGCKQRTACQSNQRQNLASAAIKSQCVRRKEGSVCRCCCDGYPCNRRGINLRCAAKMPKRRPRYHDVMPGLIKARTERTCPDYPKAPKYGKRTCSGGRSFRSYCKFTCDEGATMVGGDMSICVLRGRQYVWNRPAPKCIRHDMCASLPKTPKAVIMECDGEGEVGTVCSFACKIGYALRGPTKTTCTENGKFPEWTNKPPSCPPFCDLSKIPAPRNGTRNCIGDGQIRTTCMFTCDRGYQLDGWWVSRCSWTKEGGRWSQEAPECPAVCAEPLEAPEQGFKICAGKGEVGTTCSFSCQENHRIVGAFESTCVQSGDAALWSHESPHCEPICLSEPLPPRNGEVSCSGPHLGDVCTFGCHEGFVLVGRGSTSCVRLQKTAMWNHESPICEPICHDMPPRAPVNGDVECTGDGKLGTVCEYQCDIGFRLIGEFAAECVKANEDEAMWSSTSPICIPVCELQDPPEFGERVCNGDGEIGTTCDFVCDEEYEMYGNESMLCQEHEDRAKWSNEAPICKPIPKCEEAFPPQYGHVSCNGTGQPGTRCVYSCDTYYRREGVESATCIRDGDIAYWSEKTATCKEIEPECAPMGAIVHGKVVCDSDILRKGTTCNFQCTEPGYELLSENGADIKCEGQKRNLTWSFKKPCCVECKNVKKDIVIAMDSSGSINAAAWKNMTKFVQNIVRKFNVSSKDVQFCVFQFSDAARSEGWMYFGRYKKEQLIRQIPRMRRMGGGTKTGKGLQFAMDRLGDRRNRPDVEDMVWVITDGATEDMEQMELIAKKLRRKNVEILALAINPTENFVSQMTKMTGSQDKVLLAPSMESLSDELVSRIAVKICQESCPA